MENGKPPYVLKVNGEEMEMGFRLVVVHDILELAEKRGVIQSRPQDYRLESAVDDKHFGFNDEVDLEKDNIFVAVLDKPTPVA